MTLSLILSNLWILTSLNVQLDGGRNVRMSWVNGIIEYIHWRYASTKAQSPAAEPGQASLSDSPRVTWIDRGGASSALASWVALSVTWLGHMTRSPVKSKIRFSLTFVVLSVLVSCSSRYRRSSTTETYVVIFYLTFPFSEMTAVASRFRNDDFQSM